MTNQEYEAAMNTLAAAGRIVLSVDVDEIQSLVSEMETLAPILEPTAYVRGGGDRLLEQREFLHAAGVFRDACLRLAPEEVQG